MANEERTPPSSDVLVLDVGASEGPQQAFARALERRPDLIPADLPDLVVIKPNLCDIASWQTGATSDPAWVGVLAAAFRRRRPDVRIQIVESDAISAYKTFRSCDETFTRLGYRDAAREANVELVNLSEAPTWEIQVPTLRAPLCIPELFFREFFYVSLANVKVHPYERFTGTLKNGLGLLPQAEISDLHGALPDVIGTLYQLCTPDLAILDGRIGLEGKGPIVGETRWLGKLIVGRDALATDACAARMIGSPVDLVPHLRWTARALALDPSSARVDGAVDGIAPFRIMPGHEIILAKFKARRLHGQADGIAPRLVDWYFRAKADPLLFSRQAIKRAVRRRAS
jgi:uncharacterized protein (DUF362 family)